MKKRPVINQRGSILIYSLWVVLLLGIWAAQIGLIVGNRIALVKRIDHRGELRIIADAGVKKAISILRRDFLKSQGGYDSYLKYSWHNNEDLFKHQSIGKGFYDVSYEKLAQDGRVEFEVYGFVDEERKLNINSANRNQLMNLFQVVLGVDDEKAGRLADAVIDWRDVGRSSVSGFYSDDYYYNLDESYMPKNSSLEVLDELMLLPGFTPEFFDRLSLFLTVYGDGVVNVNTASYEVLRALGLGDVLASKVLQVRRSGDGMEATNDDYIFQRSYDVATEINQILELDLGEIKMLDQLNRQHLIKTRSGIFQVRARAHIENQKESLALICVYNAAEGWTQYCREKY